MLKRLTEMAEGYRIWPDRISTSYGTQPSIPVGAYDFSGAAAIGSDNYGWLYLNGNLIVSPNDSTQNDRNFLTGPSSIASIPAAYFKAGDNVLVAEVQNGVSIAANGPTGVVFSLSATYNVAALSTLTPPDAYNAVGTTHTVTATLDHAVAGVPITFTVSGANTDGGTVNTDANGVAEFTYLGTYAGPFVPM